MLNFPHEVKSRRCAAGMSLKTLGSRCGMSDSTISKIEKSESPNLRWDTVCGLTKALNFTPEEFLELAGYETPDTCKEKMPVFIDGILTDEEQKEVQLFVDFVIHRRKMHKNEKED